MKKELPYIDWLKYEKLAGQEGYKLFCGVDEAGRGPLAGPVCAAAAIMPDGFTLDGINDSKKLSPAKREALFDLITGNAISFGIAFASVEEIDELNILQADFLAMRRAVAMLSPQPDIMYVDGNILCPGISCEQRSLVKGDALCHSIACASILAKVSRDRLMTELDKRHPEYGFIKHKGYGTPEHLAALRKYGACEIHRNSFLKKIDGIPQ